MGQREADQEDEARGRAGCRHVPDRDRDHGDHRSGHGHGDRGCSTPGAKLPEAARKGAVPGHRERDARGREQVGAQCREHAEDAGSDDQPVPERTQEPLGGLGHEPLRVPCRRRGDSAVGRCADRRDQEEKRQIDGQGQAERQVHRARHRAAGVAHLARHGRDQVESLERDEGVAHRLQKAEGTGRIERTQPTDGLAGRGADPHPGSRHKQHDED